MNPYLNRFRHGEYLQYMRDVLTLLNKQDVTALQLNEQVAELTTITNSIDAAFKQSKGSAITQEIIALDDKRDRAIVGIRMLANTYKYHYNIQLEIAATKIAKAIAVYGNDITRKNYQEETATINSIVQDFETNTELVEALVTIHATEWVAELKKQNKEFEEKHLARVEETATNPLINVPNLREEATTIYRALISRIQAHTILSDNAIYAALISKIEVLANQYNQAVDNRSTTNTTTTAPSNEEEE